uniref:Uncharacterized protein n=1 Tax=Anguilla anguilla TaxID=7936 RepID=A0A0E9PPS8_ANGAN
MTSKSLAKYLAIREDVLHGEESYHFGGAQPPSTSLMTSRKELVSMMEASLSKAS